MSDPTGVSTPPVAPTPKPARTTKTRARGRRVNPKSATPVHVDFEPLPGPPRVDEAVSPGVEAPRIEYESVTTAHRAQLSAMFR